MSSTEPPAPAITPDQRRATGESFGIDPARYDRTRPPYPQAMIDRIVAASPGPRYLNAGCGTGIEARQFRAAGCTVLGVEPDARMAAFARRDGLDVEVARLEEWDPAGRVFDAVVSGTAWHWIDPVEGARKAAQALRPAGRLALFWHVFDLPPAVAEAFAEVYRRLLPDSPFRPPTRPDRAVDPYESILVDSADGIRDAGGFGDVRRWRFDWERRYTRDEWLDQMPTQGTLTQAPAEVVEQVLAGVGEAIDALGGSFTMGYATMVLTAARL
ncbi:class I SAM-dependent methyltransferase [Nocardia africana]|uniref:Trans-aconitate 2-methyltransferase n=1 Tax=Nocardia africana TaxID=134964 RepID=A0A378WR25_9NOCA|nr:class I SAM-dependent methyltransferase [Nocardia africana]MCC3314807.1 class I SAM-dependent methyltransferase [Nocardia africana]SUA42911.1 trans-aconitate 2-methyltransferase [Nocardia africana]